MHHCPHCQRPYQRKVYFDRHVSLCEILSKSKRDRNLEMEECMDTPTMRDLYKVVMELACKYNKLEQKYIDMEKRSYMQTQQLLKKKTIIEWLSFNHATADDYMAWFNTITITRNHLEDLFKTDYVLGVVAAIREHLAEEKDNRPLRAFTEKNNAFYIFDKEQKQWTIMDDKCYIKLMYLLDKKFMSEFVKWQTENKDIMYSDDFSLIYAKNVKKIMTTRDLAYSRIKKELYRRVHETITF